MKHRLYLMKKTCTFQLTITTAHSETVDISMFPGVSDLDDLTDDQIAEGMLARYDEYSEQASETF